MLHLAAALCDVAPHRVGNVQIFPPPSFHVPLPPTKCTPSLFSLTWPLPLAAGSSGSERWPVQTAEGGGEESVVMVN